MSQMLRSPARATVQLVAPGLVIALALLCILLWISGGEAVVMAVMRVVASNYQRAPFTDASAVLGVMQCYREGVDIYVSNPCDIPLGRPHVYSSVWLLGARTSITPASTMIVGTFMLLAFCLSMFLLPPARSRRAAILQTAAALSNAVIFSLFQANADVIIFVMIVVAAALVQRMLLLRIAGYALILAAASLKFYPLTLMVIALRERIWTFMTVSAFSLVAFAVFVWIYGSDVLRALRVVPTGWITQMYGATIIAAGLPIFPNGIRNVISAPPLTSLGLALTAGLSILCIGTSILVTRVRSIDLALRGLPSQEKCFALLGCIIMVSCFFSGQNLRYRDIFLLMLLPAWSNLATSTQPRVVKMLFGSATLLAISLMWAVLVENGIDHALTVLHVPEWIGGPAVALTWLMRELLRWVLVSVMLVTTICLVSELDLVRRYVHAWAGKGGIEGS